MPPPLLNRRHLLGAGVLGALASNAGATVAAAAMATASAAAPPPRPALRVGADQPFTRMADALTQARDGDTIEVLPGTYRGDVAVILQRRLRIVGLGAGPNERPRFVADGHHAEGKALWVVRNGDLQIENVAFQGARVPDGNGAGIRFEKGRLRLHRCRFVDNQMGLLTGNDAGSVLEITDCEFADAPLNPGSLPHLLYVGRIGHFSLRGCLLHHGREGHLVKSRARESMLVGNRLDDGREGEASYEVDLPNGGIALLEGNTLVQSPRTQNAVMLSYGAEGAPWAQNRLTLRDNTFINHREAGGSFVRVWADRLPAGTPVLSRGNRLLGRGDLALGPNGHSIDDQRGPTP